MDQHISLMILRIIIMMTCGYKISCNASQIIYWGYYFCLSLILLTIKKNNLIIVPNLIKQEFYPVR